ncbi:MAG: hypothetical protein U0K42_08240 [Bacteroidales bacterium]|nr:hypothetical protein [Bacteroidales bacterium]
MEKKYTESEIHTRDIDWFCAINGVYVHVASAGGDIPRIINDRNVLRPCQRAVEALEDINTDEEVHINDAFLRRMNVNLESYLPSFVRMAKKGFYSFYRTNINDPDDDHYHLVAWPTHPVANVENIPVINSDRLDFDNPDLMNDIPLKEIIEHSLLNH